MERVLEEHAEKEGFDLDAVCCILIHRRSSALWEEGPVCSKWF